MRRALAAGLAVLLGCATARAAEFPTRPITLIVPVTAGGATDICMRAIAESVARTLRQPVVVDNKLGAAGTLGPATMAATAKPDGYTVSQMPASVFRLPMMQSVAYDPLTDFTYIAHLTGYTLGVVVAADAPWKTLPDMLAYAKAEPGKLSYGTPGAGSVAHLTMARLAREQGLSFTHVPFRGGSEAYAALLGGHVRAAADASGFAAMVDAGQLRLLAVWGKQRAKRWPDVPTLSELGYKIVAESPFGVAGPKGMDPAVVAVLSKAFQDSLADPAVVAVLDRLDMRADPMGPADYAAFVRTQIADERITLEAADMLKK